MAINTARDVIRHAGSLLQLASVGINLYDSYAKGDITEEELLSRWKASGGKFEDAVEDWESAKQNLQASSNYARGQT